MTQHIAAFGIHQATFKDLLDPSVWGVAKILGSAEPDLKQELIPLEGGSSIVPWGAAPGRASGEITLTIREYEKNVLRFLAPWKSDTDSEDADGEAAGSVTTPVNVVGTTAKSATIGVASIAVTTAASLAPGNYKAVVTAAATLDIYCDFDGTGNATYQDNNGKINDTAITIVSASTTVFKGLTFTGGSGTIGMTVGDIMTFTVNPISSYILKNYFGKVGAQLREFELTVYGECVGGRIRRTTYPRCVASASTPIAFLENDWASMEATVQVLTPETVDYVAESVFFNK